MTEQNQATPPSKGGGGNKPVVIYIMVLFIAAFLLMALSFLMHQRSNTEVVGQLQNSVSTLQEVQSLQTQVIDLQNKLEEAKEQEETFREASEAAQDRENLLEEQLTRTVTAMNWYCQLNEAYVLEDTDRCQIILQALKEPAGAPLYEALPKEADQIEGSQTAPYDRFLEIRESIEAFAPEE